MTPPTEDRFSAFGSRVPQSDDLFRLAFEHAPIAKVLVGLDGRCHLANPAMCPFTGYTEHELIGMPMARLSHPEDPDDSLIATDRLRDQVYTVGAIDKRYLTATGTIVWGAQSVTLVRGASGLRMHFIVQIQDITTRKQQEQELVEERRRLRDAESTGMIGSWERNLDTGTITWSNGMFELFGPDPEGSGRDLYAAREQIYPEDRATLDTAVQACVTIGDPIRVRYRVTRTDGATRWFDVRGEARYQNGRRNRICGTVIDVTDQVAAQSEAAAAYAMQQAVIKASPDIIELWDVRSGSGRWSNRPVGETLGYSAKRSPRDVAEELTRNEIGAVLVADGARTGLISERDVIAALSTGVDAGIRQIGENFTADLVWASPDDSIVSDGVKMVEAGVRHLPVGDHRIAIGIVSARDVLGVLIAAAAEYPNFDRDSGV